MKTDIEKLKEERDSAINMLEEVMRPHGIYDQAVSTSKKAFADAFMETGDKIRATVEAFKPKAEPLEGWVNTYGPTRLTKIIIHDTPQGAEEMAGPGVIRRAVHLREVTPVEWERWKVGEIGSWSAVAERNGKLIATAPAPNCKLIADAHNLEMQRVTGTEGK